MHSSVTVNSKPVERFRTSYNNPFPFAVRFNSKLYDRYMALFIPSSLIPNGALFINAQVDMRSSDNHIFIREIGTHDY